MYFLRRHKGKIIILVIIIAVIAMIYFWDFSQAKVKWGVTFNQEYAQNELGLDWQKAYLAILDDLKVDHVRLSAYWDHIEPIKGTYDFKDLDFQVNEASKRNVGIVMGVGRKLPRWPECHSPAWIKDMDIKDVQKDQLSYMSEVIKRYDGDKNLLYWQVENEPYLSFFGECPELDKEFLKQEVALVKELSDKPIMITDSGELSTWVSAAKTGGDILGTTLYRVVYNEKFGYFNWFLPPSFYYAKSTLIKKFTPTKKVIVAELQTEAWHKKGENLKDMTIDTAFESMSLKQFKNNISFAKKAGFDEVYLWGAEWWYLMKENKSYDSYWNTAKALWQK